LPVYIGNANPVRINDGQKMDARSDKTFGTPAANSTNTKDNHLFTGNLLHLRFPK
jgi:hypothetical protein